ncbi:MAG: hypothetical protein IJO03_03235 [Clostridia bacterium]|nr:hypothetical protein [Clostridia bacterium]
MISRADDIRHYRVNLLLRARNGYYPFRGFTPHPSLRDTFSSRRRLARVADHYTVPPWAEILRSE